MYSQKQSTRQAPGIFSYMELFSSKFLAYSIFLATPVGTAFFALVLYAIFRGAWNVFYFLEMLLIFMAISGSGVLVSIVIFSHQAPILKAPPDGWSIQMNSFFSAVIGGTYLFGLLLAYIFEVVAFQEVFFMLGTLISYIMAFVIYFSFTNVKWVGSLVLALTQPVIGIISYYFIFIYTNQVSIGFFIRAIVFFCTCAFIFAVPYGRGMFQVSNIYRRVTGLGGYTFIRAFVLSMLTEKNDGPIEEIFDKVGVKSNVKIQYLAFRSEKTKNIKGLFVVPHVHFGPFKTCGSSDLPEQIYRALIHIPGITVYHTTNDHTYNLTNQQNVDKVVKQIKEDVKKIENDPRKRWNNKVEDVTRKISNSAKLIGTVIDNVPLIFLTRHPLPSDDIQAEIGEEIRDIATKNGKKEIIIIDSHNSIIGDEILITKGTIEGNDLTNVAKNFIIDEKRKNIEETPLLYGVAKDPVVEYSEKDGIGYGGMVVHLFQNDLTKQKTALIHFDGNNAYLDIRSFILNHLQNRGIVMGEVTTSDSHTVARQFTSRGYSPIGDKIKIDFILEKLENLLEVAEQNLEPIEVHYGDSIVEDVKIWGDPKYFEVILDTLQECIIKSQKLLTYSLILPTLFSFILLIFFYNVPLTNII